MAWTKEQEEAIEKTGTNIIVSAGAGSGKTAVLTERTIRKLINGGDINRLLILTFTNAAASEMKDRIRRAIKKAGLKEQLDYIDSAYITTFDSFALSTVRKYNTALGVSPNISIMDSSIELLKTNEILDEIFESMYGNSEFEKLIGDFSVKSDDSMKSVIKNISNKLDLLTNKEEYLLSYIDTHFDSKYIESNIELYISNLIDLKNSIKPHYEELATLVDQKFLESYNLSSLLEANSYDEIKSALDIIGSPRKNKNCYDDFKIYKDKINDIISKLKNLTRFNSTDEIRDSIINTKPYIKAIIDIILKFDAAFLTYKKENDLYTFNDIAKLAIKVVKENESVKESLRNSFDEIMIDEYQDTSDIQEEFINLISNNNVYMVGDIKQSIYRFRNANPYIFRDKYDLYKNFIGGIKIDLLKNFRSRPEVLDNINLIFNLIMDKDIGDAEYKESHQMNFGNTSYIESLKTTEDNNMDIFTYCAKDSIYSTDEIEAFIVARDIKKKVSSNYPIVDKKTNTLRNSKYSDFAIIMDRGSSFELYKKIFEYVGVPIVQIKNEKLTLGDDILVIKNLINLIIKINYNSLDDEFKYLFTSVSRSYLFKTPDEEIFDILRFNKFYTSDLYKLCKSINIFEISTLDLVNQIIDTFNLYQKLITTNDIETSIIKIDYLKDLSKNLSNIGYTPLMFAKYLDDILLAGDIEYSLNTSDSDSVKILNIHKSKGLEYSVCYFTGLSKRANNEDSKSKFIVDSNNNIIIPYVDNGIKDTIYKDLFLSKELRDSISEKIRLFYVALTRAREKIIMVCPLDYNKTSYTDVVPKSVRLEYNKISDMLESISEVLTPYIKALDLDELGLTKDYSKIKNYNYKKEIKANSERIVKLKNNIQYENLNTSKFSKKVENLITKEEYNNLKEGIKLHYIFETEDFNKTNNPFVLKFLKHIDTNYNNIYKEYEFIYIDEKVERRGFIDLMLEYDDHIDIIDYKMKNILDDNYLKQLNGYKNYIETVSKKRVKTYLYSILDDKLVLLD